MINNIGTIVFFVAFILIFVLVLFVILTKKGRNFTIDKFMGEIVQDYGLMSEMNFLFGKQKVRLLKCIKNQEIFYVIETEYRTFGSVQINYTKIDTETADKFVNILSAKN